MFDFEPFDYISIQLLKSQKKKINSVLIKGSINSPGLYPLYNNQETLKSLIDRLEAFIHQQTCIM